MHMSSSCLRLFLAAVATLLQCTTSTLAMGVNLPAHLVVVKGTRRVRPWGHTSFLDAQPGLRADVLHWNSHQCCGAQPHEPPMQGKESETAPAL